VHVFVIVIPLRVIFKLNRFIMIFEQLILNNLCDNLFLLVKNNEKKKKKKRIRA